MMHRNAKFFVVLTALFVSGIGLEMPEAQAQDLIWPAKGCTYISSPYGPRGSSGYIHSGTDIACGGNIQILAAGDGKVVYRTYSSGQCTYSSSAGTCPTCDNHNGNSVRIDHGGGLQTNYLHMKEVYVAKGDTVKCGQVIGLMGTTGCSTGQHLHFMVYDPYSTHKDPMNYVTKGDYTCPVTCVASTEVCDGVDNDCDGATDEDGVCEPTYDPMYQSMIYDPQNTDINGDGTADICARGYSGIYCAFTKQGSYSTHSLVLELGNTQGWDDVSNYATIKFADVNGDNKADICARANAGIMCWTSKGNGFNGAGATLAMSDDNGYNDVKYYSTIRFGDINGDGKDDVCARFKDGFKCYPSTGTGWGSAIALGDMADSSGWGSPQYYSTIRMADINGDGKVDVCGRGSAGFRCWLSNGTKFTEIATPITAWNNTNKWDDPKYYATIRMADINGDHKADVCGRDKDGVVCYLSNGTSFVSALRGPNLTDDSGWGDYDNYSTMHMGDINGDGKDDLCIRANAKLGCYMSTGSGFGTHYPINDMSDANGWNKPQQYRTIRVGDVNGDGKMDVCGRSAAGVRCYIFNGSGFNAAAEGPEFSDAGGWHNPMYYSTLRMGGPLTKTCSLQKEICDSVDNNCNGKIDENNVCCVPSAEICDSKDNDCDGQVDEGGVCCTAEICDGKDNDCDGSIDEDNVCCKPSDEICDGKDNDCDNEIDEGGVCCTAEICDGKDNDCDGQIDEDNVCCTPTDEICDGKDNDCDHEIDEGNVCVVPDECEPTDEICDDKDNDCDGQIDEDNVCCEPTDEICDGKDNDCDHEIDEGDVCVVPDDCEPTDEICDGKDNDCDGWVDENNICCEPTDEICDGKDNDCDGQIDEDNVCPPAADDPSVPTVDFVGIENCSASPLAPPSHHVFGIFTLVALLGLSLRRKRG